MLTSATTLIERRAVIGGHFATHPYEAGWAAEALFFLRVDGPHPELSVQAQISPDGVLWLDRGEPVRLSSSASVVDVAIRDFGTWIRLAITGASQDRTATVSVHLALKG